MWSNASASGLSSGAPRLRRDPAAPDRTYYECCRAANGFDVPKGQVLYLVSFGAEGEIVIGKRWVATHALPGATFAQVMAGISIGPGSGLAFGSNEADVTSGGPHEWQWHPLLHYQLSRQKDLHIAGLLGTVRATEAQEGPGRALRDNNNTTC